MPISKAQFMVIYDGPALKGNQMDVRELAPALLALGDILDSANKVLNGGRARVAISVKAFKGGCFGVLLEVAQDMLTYARDLFSEDGKVREALEILNLLGFTVKDAAGAALISLYALIKFCKGRKVKKRIQHQNGDVTLYFDDADTDAEITVSNGVDKLYSSPQVRDAIAKSLEPLQHDGIDSFGVEEAGQRKILVTREDAEYYDAPEIEPRPIPVNEEPQERILSITTLSFKEANKWKLSDGNANMNVKIEDKDFLNKINDGMPFSKGDMLKVMLLAKPVYGKNGLTTEYVATKVIEVIRTPAQLWLTDQK